MKNRIIKKDELYKADHGWLKSYHIFSFADYYDTNNLDFGNLRVFNDDYIGGKTGFPLHPHSNMEILTIVLEGEITHGDTMGNKETIKGGEIQTMTAGSGIFHSEENKSDEDMHLYQIWFKPNSNGLKPGYKNHKIDLETNNLNLLASGKKEDNVGFLNTNINVFRGIFDENKTVEYEVKEGKGLFLYNYKGEIEIDNYTLIEKDHIRYSKPGNYSFKTKSKSDFIIIEVDL